MYDPVAASNSESTAEAASASERASPGPLALRRPRLGVRVPGLAQCQQAPRLLERSRPGTEPTRTRTPSRSRNAKRDRVQKLKLAAAALSLPVPVRLGSRWPGPPGPAGAATVPVPVPLARPTTRSPLEINHRADPGPCT